MRYREGAQSQVTVKEFAEQVRKNRPAWLIELISSLSPIATTDTEQIREELQRLLDTLRVRTKGPRLDPKGEIAVEPNGGRGARPEPDGQHEGTGERPRIIPDDLLVLVSGAKRASISLNAERVPEIIPLHDEEAIDEKGLRGKAAKFYPDAAQLFVNMLYPAVIGVRTQLEAEYAGAADPEAMRHMALEAAERTMMVGVGRAVVYALAKQGDRDWTTEDMDRAQSPESLSLAADDFVDALQNARRKMGQALRTVRQDAVLTTSP